MGNTEKKESKKLRRKIRIRLTDPSIPDSYICEIFDSSLENDDEFSRNDNVLQKGEDSSSPPKPKNYFDLLMSKNCNKSDVRRNNASKISCDDDDDDDDDDSDDSDHGHSYDYNEPLQKRTQKITKKSRNSLEDSPGSKRRFKYKLESSAAKSFFQLEGKIKSKDTVLKEETESDKNFKEEHELQNDNLVTIFDSPKINCNGKKTLSILNYFSRKEISPDINSKCHKLDENSIGKVKTCQSTNKFYHSYKSESKKSCENGAKRVFLNGINKENFKLAPLFCKKGDNLISNSVRQKANVKFFNKESASVIKKSETKVLEDFSYFPKITHVQQRNESIFWSLRQICLPFQKVNKSECVFNEKKKFSLQIKQFPVMSRTVSDDRINFNKELLNKMKCKYLELNLDSVIDGLKDNRDKFVAQMDKIEKSKKNALKAQDDDDLGYEELNMLWTEKYKPKSNEILGNYNAVKKLKKWLQTWKCFNDELKVLANSNQRSNSKEDSSDDDEDNFLDLANKNYGLKVPGNVCIISGPNGCGKSALVYALANELEFNILELNASNKRTGKKVLSDLQEATQSHKVNRVNLQQPVEVEIAAKKKKKAKNPKKILNRERVKMTDQANDCKISLILIEDADIVFDDHDEGFYSAIGSLVQTSKRPLIFLTNEPDFLCFENLKSEQCLKLEMEPPNFYKSCAVLDVVSSLEGFHFEKEILESVLRQNRFDLRRSLLELQFWVGSTRIIKNPQNAFDLGHLWWGLSKFLFNQDLMQLVKCKGRKRKRINELFDSSDDDIESVPKKFKSDSEISKDLYCGRKGEASKTSDSSIESYFRVFDVTSVLDGFRINSSREPLPENECRLKDSLALCENMEEVLWGRKLTEELSDEMMSLSAKIFSDGLKKEKSADRKLDFVSPCWEEVRWRSCRAKASEELSCLVSLQKRGDKRSLYLDYLPVLRNICRVERHRSEMNPKRKNRFYHYLNSVAPELTEKNLDINCEVFSR